MTPVLPARDVTLRDLIDQFGLQRADAPHVFLEWQENLPELTASDREFLDRIRDGFLNLLTDPPLLEKPIQFSVLAPLLFLADFYREPFLIRAEASTEITAEDDGITLRGLIDVLVLKEKFWVVVVESKRADFAVEAGLPQLLSYMLAAPTPRRPVYGLITNGGSFLFVKVFDDEGTPYYARSDQFNTLNRGNELYEVLRILKKLGRL